MLTPPLLLLLLLLLPLPPYTVGVAYAYAEDLFALEIAPCLPTAIVDHHSALPAPYQSLLRGATWQEGLCNHPDRWLCEFLARGLHNGFHLTYLAQRTRLRPVKWNILSPYEHPQVVDAYLANECRLCRVLGPFPQPLGALHINRFGVIPKDPSQESGASSWICLSLWGLVLTMAFLVTSAPCGTP